VEHTDWRDGQYIDTSLRSSSTFTLQRRNHGNVFKGMSLHTSTSYIAGLRGAAAMASDYSAVYDLVTVGSIAPETRVSY